MEILIEPSDPDNANEALLLLGIAERDTAVPATGRASRLKLLPWAVQAALSRRHQPLSAKDVLNIRVCTLDPDTLRWPASTRRESDD